MLSFAAEHLMRAAMLRGWQCTCVPDAISSTCSASNPPPVTYPSIAISSYMQGGVPTLGTGFATLPAGMFQGLAALHTL